MTAPKDDREQVLEFIRGRSPVTRKEILAACDLVENGKRLSNILFALRTAGEIRRDDNGNWLRIGPDGSAAGAPSWIRPEPSGSASTAEPAAAPRKKTTAKRRSPRPAAPPAAAEGAGVRMAERAQQLLDDYLREVGDPAIVDPLIALRDGARAAGRA